jgi:hypothetical protein
MRLSLTILLLLAACTAPDPHGDSAQRDLAAELAGRTAGPPQDCVQTLPATNLRIVDERTVTYRDGPTIYVNHLIAECPGLRPMDTLIIQENEGGRYCRGDHFRSVPFGGSAVPGPICGLGSFIPYRRPR